MIKSNRLDAITTVTKLIASLGLLLAIVFLLLFLQMDGINRLLSPQPPLPEGADDLPDFEGFFMAFGFIGCIICGSAAVLGLLFNYGLIKRQNYARYGLSLIYLFGIVILLGIFYIELSFLINLIDHDLFILIRIIIPNSILVALFAWAIFVVYTLIFDPTTKQSFFKVPSSIELL